MKNKVSTIQFTSPDIANLVEKKEARSPKNMDINQKDVQTDTLHK